TASRTSTRTSPVGGEAPARRRPAPNRIVRSGQTPSAAGRNMEASSGGNELILAYPRRMRVASGFVGRAEQTDLSQFRRRGRRGVGEVMLNGVKLGRFHPTGRIIAYGGEGNDVIAADRRISLPAELYGGGGDDRLTGGRG